MQADSSWSPCLEIQDPRYPHVVGGQSNGRDQSSLHAGVSNQCLAHYGDTGNALPSQDLLRQAKKEEPSEEIPSGWSEAGNVPKRNLGLLQAISLVINLIVGSGIFTNAGYVLALTRSKAICLVLWAAGGVYTALWYDATSTFFTM